MTPAENEFIAPARRARLLYGLYQDLGREFTIEMPPCDGLENAQDENATPMSLAAASAWFLDADSRIPVHQLRQFLQTSKLVNQGSLRAALDHFLHKSDRGAADRDKIDFLLVQFCSVCAASQTPDA